MIYDLRATSPQNFDVACAPYHCTFQFLPFSRGFSIFADPSTDWEPRADLRVPFRASPRDRLLLVGIRGFCLFICSQSLLDHSHDPEFSTSHHVWSWGTWCSGDFHNLALLSDQQSIPIYSCISYMRCVETLRSIHFNNDKIHLQIYDCHPERIAPSKRNCLEVEGWKRLGPRGLYPWARNSMDSDVSVVPSAFCKDLTLPFQVDSYATATVMLSQDTLVVLEVRSLSCLSSWHVNHVRGVFSGGMMIQGKSITSLSEPF